MKGYFIIDNIFKFLQYPNMYCSVPFSCLFTALKMLLVFSETPEINDFFKFILKIILFHASFDQVHCR